MRLRSILLLLFVFSYAQAADSPRRAKNVILFLADAGGVATINAASIYAYDGAQKLFIQSFPYVALSDTSTASQWVSDSAAGMTAIVAGQKTHNGMISQGPDGVRGSKDGTPLKTILEYAEERGLATGVLSNVTITDATPAACYAHVNDRKKWGEIFLQLFTPRFGDGVDILIGPGRERIAKQVTALGQDLVEAGKAAGRPVYATLDELPRDARRGIVVIDGDVDLPRAAKTAIRALEKNPKGYFLMIESDAHTDDPEAGLKRLVAFDNLIREISNMVNMKATLLIFTADHSFDVRVRSGKPGEPLLKGYAEWKTANAGKKGPIQLPSLRVDNGHTGEEVVIAAKGPGAERVRGFVPNSEIFNIMLRAYGWSESRKAASE